MSKDTEKLHDKGDEELSFWINVWNKKIIEAGYWTSDTLALVGIDKPMPTYDENRENEARAQAYRLLGMARKPKDYLKDKAVVEIGPGCCGALEMTDARIKIAIEPLAEKYRNNSLLLRNDHGAVYLSCGSESIPLMSEYADIVIASNCLDHVVDIEQSVAEIYRILKKGGELFLNIEIDHPPSPCEPHSLSYDDLITLFRHFKPAFINKDTDNDGRKWVRAVYGKTDSGGYGQFNKKDAEAILAKKYAPQIEAMGRTIKDLTKRLEFAEADREARLQVINELAKFDIRMIGMKRVIYYLLKKVRKNG